MRVLVVGGDSRIGQLAGLRLRASGCQVEMTTRRPGKASGDHGWHFLDLADVDEAAVTALPGCDVAIFAAAVTRMQDCRNEPELSRLINVSAPETLARRVHEMGGRIILLSTNAVFDGSQPKRSAFDEPDGLTAYGRQKAEAERIFLEIAADAAILRMSKVVEHAPPLFQEWAVRLMAGEEITPFSDMVLAPVPIEDAVSAICHIATSGGAGIYQISADHDIGYVQAAGEIARVLGADNKLIRPVRARELGFPAEELNRFTSLDSSRLQEEMPLQPIDPVEAVIRSIDLAAIGKSTTR